MHRCYCKVCLGLIVGVCLAEAQPADQPHVHTETASQVAFFVGKVGAVSSATSSGVSVTPGTGTLTITGYAPHVFIDGPTKAL